MTERSEGTINTASFERSEDSLIRTPPKAVAR